MAAKTDKAKQLHKKIAESPTFKKMEEMTASEKAKWDQEIASLESRVYTEVVDYDLGNGTTIAIRVCLLDSEAKRLAELEKLQLKSEDEEEKTAMVCEMIEIITANPNITKEWLMENRDKYSPVDIFDILFGYREVRLLERIEKVKRVQSSADFRIKQGGP